MALVKFDPGYPFKPIIIAIPDESVDIFCVCIDGRFDKCENCPHADTKLCELASSGKDPHWFIPD